MRGRAVAVLLQVLVFVAVCVVSGLYVGFTNEEYPIDGPQRLAEYSWNGILIIGPFVAIPFGVVIVLTWLVGRRKPEGNKQ